MRLSVAWLGKRVHDRMSVAEILARRRQRQVAPVVSPASSSSSSIMSSYTTARPAPVVTQPALSSAPLLAPPSHYPQFEEKTVEHVVSEDVYPPDEPRLLEFPPVMSPSLPPAHKSLFSDVKASLASLQSTIQNMSLGMSRPQAVACL